MAVLLEILREFWAVLAVMSPYLLFGFLVAGLLSQLVSPKFVERHLGGRGLGPVLKAAAFGVPLPLCSCGVIPVSASLRRHGASKGATAAFLISTPQTGVDSILVTLALLGPLFAIIRPVAALISGVIGGLLVDLRTKPDPPVEVPNSVGCTDDACSSPVLAASWKGKWTEGLRYGFVTLPADIARAMTVGLLVAALISALLPEAFFAERLGGVLGGGIVAMLVMLALGLPMYVCATASVPLAWALMAKGVSPGAALVFLMTGPATNAATIAVLWKVLGRGSAMIYLLTVALSALAAGALLDLLVEVVPVTEQVHHHEWMLPAWFNTICAIALIGVLANAFRHRSKPEPMTLPPEPVAGQQRVRIGISGMTCSHCTAAVERALLEVPGVHAAEVDLPGKTARVSWNRPIQEQEALRRAVTVLGYNVSTIEVE